VVCEASKVQWHSEEGPAAGDNDAHVTCLSRDHFSCPPSDVQQVQPDQVYQIDDGVIVNTG
jgi:hypothetical protein